MKGRASALSAGASRVASMLGDSFVRCLFAIFAVMVLMGVYGAQLRGGWLSPSGALSVALALALSGMAYLFGAMAKGRSSRSFWTAPRIGFAAILVFYLLTRIGYLWAFDNDFRFDFLRYWNRLPNLDQGTLGLLDLRTFAMFYPWRLFFAEGTHFFEITNVAYGAASLALVFLIGRAMFSERVGCLAALVFVLWPESLLWVQVPTHDLVSQFVFLLATWAVVTMSRRRPASVRALIPWVVLGFTTGVVLAWFELVRATSVFLFVGGALAALILLAGARGAEAKRGAIAGLLSVLVVAGATHAALAVRDVVVLPALFEHYDSEALDAESSWRMMRWYGGYAPIESIGRSIDIAVFAPYAHLPDARQLTRDLFLSASADDPPGRLAYWMRKALQFTYPGYPGTNGGIGYYLRITADQSGADTRTLAAVALHYHNIFSAGIYIFLAAGFIAAIYSVPVRFSIVFPLVTLAAFTGGLVLLVEAQPRFFYQLVPLGGIYAVAGLGGLARLRTIPTPASHAFRILAGRGGHALLGSLLVLLIAVAGVYALQSVYTHENGRLVNLRQTVSEGAGIGSRHPYLLEMDLLPFRGEASFDLALPDALRGREVTAALFGDGAEGAGTSCTITVEGVSGTERLFNIDLAGSSRAVAVSWVQPENDAGIRLTARAICDATGLPETRLQFGFVRIAPAGGET